MFTKGTASPFQVIKMIKAIKKFRVGAGVVLLALFLANACGSADAAAPQTMYDAFWARNWRAMDAVSADIAARSKDLRAPKLTARDKSLYLNGLWLQSRYAEGVAVLDSIQPDFPDELKPYGRMFTVLGLERTGRKEAAAAAGEALWNDAPEGVKYYLAYAMGRISRDLSKDADAMTWFRRMLELAPDRKRRLQALNQMIALPGMTPVEAATMLIDAPSNAKAKAACDKVPKGTSSRVEYALGYNAYVNKKYETAMTHLRLASADVAYGEAAQYYHGYAAYREKKNDTAYKSWERIALTGNDYPQRSVARLTTLASRGKKPQVVALFKKVAETRTDYPELAADALVGIIRLGEGAEVTAAEKKLFGEYGATNQAATARWEKGWRAWKAKNYKEAEAQWSAGHSLAIPSRELGARLLYWQSRALEKLKSPEAATRVRVSLVDNYPAEYHTFLVSPDGGIRDTRVPKSYNDANLLEDWGFITYARLDAAYRTMDKPDKEKKPEVTDLYRVVRLSSWEGDHSFAVRAFATLARNIPATELASARLLRYNFPKAFEADVDAASKKTGLDRAVIWGIMRQESLYEPDVTSVAGAYGLMQLMPGTAKGEAERMKMGANAWRTVSGNIMLGANHMVGLLARFKETPLALAAYNAGGTPVTRWSKDGIPDMTEWIEDIGYPETRGYVKAVLRNINVYNHLYPKPKPKPEGQ